MTLTRITIGPAICAGEACIHELRFPVARRLDPLASGEARDAVVKAYPYLEPGGIDEAPRFATLLAGDDTEAGNSFLKTLI
jgi:uncharacterized protein (DUF433 family)